jgi:putative ABC transport system permease protein
MIRWKQEIRNRLAHLKLEPTREAEIIEELSQHLEDRFVELLISGSTEEDARAAVMAELSQTDLLARELRRVEREVAREPAVMGARRMNMIGDLWQDLQYAVRTLWKSPGFSAIAVLTLALGIGANTAIFSIVNGVLLRPLPFNQPDRLATLWAASPEEKLRKMQVPDRLFAFFRQHSQMFDELAGYNGGNGFNLTGKGEPERLNCAVVTAGFFELLRNEPIYGRSFLPQEDRTGANSVAILSYGLWQRQFGGDPEIVGRTLNLNNVPTEVVGIMPPNFDFPERTEVWIPLGLNPDGPNESWYIDSIARLRPGVTMADAEREMSALWNEYQRLRNSPESESRPWIRVRPLTKLVVGEVRTPLLILLGAVSLVLLIACANIANLLLARATARSREIAVRCCLGASRWRIIKQLLTESLLLSLIGGGVGLLLAFAGVQAFKGLAPGDVARIEQLDMTGVQLPRLEEVRVDPTVLGFTFAVALLTGLLFGLVPTMRAARVNLHEDIKEAVRGSASRSPRRLNDAFVIGQLAFSLVLLVGAALLLQSFKNLLSVDPGFRPANVWTGRVDLPNNKYPDDAQVRRFYGRLLESVEHLPGVRSAGLCQRLPFFGGGDGNTFSAEGLEPPPSEPLTQAWYRDVSPGYFDTMGIPILSGRRFLETDCETSPLVAIVDETLARRFWPGEDAIGKRIRLGRASWKTSLMTVVGVVASVKHRSLDEESSDYVYWPASQHVRSSMYLVVRTDGKPDGITSGVVNRLNTLDPEFPLFEVLTMDRAVDYSLTARRLTNNLLAGFAITALLLAMIGIYGVMSLNVTSRTREFGIRLALGASRVGVLKLVIGQGMRLAFGGTVVGLISAMWLTTYLQSLLFNVKPIDPLIFSIVALMLIAVAFVACYVPARRATLVDPMVALRCE